MAKKNETSPLDNAIDFFSAVEIVVANKKLSAKKAEAWLKEKLADGSVALVKEGGYHLTPDEFAAQLANV